MNLVPRPAASASAAAARLRRAAAVVLAAVVGASLVLPAGPAAATTTPTPTPTPTPSASAPASVITVTGDTTADTYLCAVVPWTTAGRAHYTWSLDGASIADLDNRCYWRDPKNDSGRLLSVTADEVTDTGTEHGASAQVGPLATRITVPRMAVIGQPDAGSKLWPEFPGNPQPAPTAVPATTPPLPLTYAYAWTRDGTAIPGGTGAVYTVTSEDRGHRLEVTVTVSTYGSSAAAAAGVLVPATRRGAGFNADGTADVFARNAAGDLLLYPGDGRGGWLAPQTIGWGWGGFNLLLAPGDFDGDGFTDVMGRDDQGRLYLYQGNGSGGWKNAVQVGQGWQGFTAIIAPGDFNGDGTNDLLARDPDGALWLYPGNGRGGWLEPSVVGLGWQALHHITSADDFSGDHAPDVFGVDYLNGQGPLRLYLGAGDGGFRTAAPTTVGWGWWDLKTVGAPGDFNGDGDVDLFAIDSAGQLTMYWGAGTDMTRYDAAARFKGQATIGWGWGGMTAVF
ncbi:FG-GAP repeat domain-containing protein [Sinomonas flava]|uniref:FG-GAP repeat domain-containing protein n=1 Tax=Sinomonas flava TaxID=496857 RepID=UPI0031DC2761